MAEDTTTVQLHDLSQLVFESLVDQGIIEGKIDRETIADALAKNEELRKWIKRHCVEETKLKAFELLRDAEDEIERWRDACRDTITALIPFVTERGTNRVNNLIEKLRKALANDSDVEIFQNTVSELKNLLIKEPKKATGGSETEARQHGLFGRLLHRGGQVSDDLKKFLGDIIQTIESLLKPEDKKTYNLDEIKRMVNKARTVDELAAVSSSLLEVMNTLSKEVETEREQVNAFIKELGRNLVELEKNVMLSVDSSKKSRESNRAFDSHLNAQINDLDLITTSGKKSLEELRSIVIAKIASIRKALEAKQKQEKIYNLELDRRFRRLQRDLTHLNQEIQAIQSKEKILKEQILTDPLTGAPNRRAYEMRIQEEFQRFKRYGQSFSLMVLDLDRFKNINDTYGHSAGDLVLKEIVRRIRANLRESDMFFRYGGEEFVIILPGTDTRGAIEVGEKIRKLIESTKFVYKGNILPITVSIGVTVVSEKDSSPMDIFDRADEALYRAKTAGRNKVMIG